MNRVPLIVLLLLAILVALGGFAGIAIQMVAPRLLTLSVRFEHKPEDIEEVLDELRETAEKIGTDDEVSKELTTYYERVVQPILASPLLALESIFHTAPGASRRARAYQHIVNVLHPDERPHLDELQDMLTQRDEILIQRYLTGLLRGWLSFHIPIAGALIAALIVHVWSVFYF